MFLTTGASPVRHQPVRGRLFSLAHVLRPRNEGPRALQRLHPRLPAVTSSRVTSPAACARQGPAEIACVRRASERRLCLSDVDCDDINAFVIYLWA